MGGAGRSGRGAPAVLAAALLAGAASPALAREIVAVDPAAAPGTVVIVTHERRLYLVTAPGEALRYPVGVGKAGKQWHGRSYIDGKYVRPDWTPPADVRRDHPDIPALIAGGDPRNPMGVAALTLAGDRYAIHGTTRAMRRSVGTFASYGCIRMLNEDVADLYGRVSVGTPVIVVP